MHLCCLEMYFLLYKKLRHHVLHATNCYRYLMTEVNQNFSKLNLQLSGEPFVKATYKLEGDDALAFTCYEIYTSLEERVRLQHYPNLNAVASKLCRTSTTLYNKLIQYGKARVQVEIEA